MKLKSSQACLYGICLIGLVLGVGIFIATLHRSYETTLGNGIAIRITPASSFASWFSESNCQMDCRTKTGKVGSITFLEGGANFFL